MTDDELLEVLKATAATDEYRAELVETIEDDEPHPEFDRWFRYVPGRFRRLWGQLSIGQRVIVYLTAEERRQNAPGRDD